MGVIVGSGITGGFQWALTVRGDRRDSRAARRLVQGELLGVWVALRHGIRDGNWDTVMEGLRDRSQFEQHRPRLARELDDAAWNTVERAYRNQWAVVRVVDLPAGHDDKDESVYEVAYVAIEDAIRVLGESPSRHDEEL